MGSSCGKNVKATTPQLEAVQQQIEMLQKKIEEKKASIQKIGEELERDNLELAQVEEYLRKHNDASVAALQRERDSLTKDITSLKKHVQEEETSRETVILWTLLPIFSLKTRSRPHINSFSTKSTKENSPHG